MLQIDETVSKQTLIRFLELPMVATTLTIYGVATLMKWNQPLKEKAMRIHSIL